MALYTIADLHLSTLDSTNKSMEVFGKRWLGYMEKIKKLREMVFDTKENDSRCKAYYDKYFASIRSNGYSYALDPKQNSNPETAYFCGMALRVIRAFDFLKTLPQWDGKNLIAQGGSQGGLQTVWAAALVDGLSVAKPTVPWCGDIGGEQAKRIQFRTPLLRLLSNRRCLVLK